MSGNPCLLFMIPSLAAGGAERQLCELVGHLDRTRFEIHVLVFYRPGQGNRGELWAEMERLHGVHLHALDKRRGALGYLAAIPRALDLIRRIRPDVIHGYSDANLLALLLGRLSCSRVVWGIRRTSQDLAKLDRISLRLLKVMVRLARFVDLVIFNSAAGQLSHQRMGMRSARMCVVTNGFDVDRFAPDPGLGSAQRLRWGIPADAALIGIVGRLDPIKDHPTFLRLAARVAGQWPEARFVCAGGGPAGYRQELETLAASLGIADRVLWSGVSTDMPALYNALTLLVLSSTDEGFPNVVGEAMACGVPCVATQVGDAAVLIGGTGFTAGVGDDEALARAVSSLLLEPPEARTARSQAARARICSQFSVAALAQNTERALAPLLPCDRGAPSPARAE